MSDSNDCSLAKPCATLTKALSLGPSKAYIKATGNVIDTAITTIENRTVTIYGVPEGTTISRTMDGSVLEIKKAANVTLVGLEIKAGATNSDGVVIKEMPGPTVTMNRVKLSDHSSTGVTLANGTLTMFRSDVMRNHVFGIDASAGTLTLDNSRIYDNQGNVGIRAAVGVNMVTIKSSVIASNQGGGGGLDIAANFSIINSIIVGNGKAISGQIGGAFLHAQSGVFAFNTVADNISGATGTAGVSCSGGTRILSNSILLDGIDSGCTSVNYSLTGRVGVPTAGMSNKVGDPKFFQPSTDPTNSRFYRIDVDSAARDGGDPASTEMKDIDGQSRSDGKPDMGADEYVEN